MLGANEKVQRAISQMQYKLFDTLVQALGTGSTNTFLIQVEQDKYQNKEYKILGYTPISCIINFPDNEIPVSLMGNDSNLESSSVLHLYDLIPITARFKFSDNVKKGNIILYKVKMAGTENKYHVLALELVGLIAKTTRTNIMYHEWNVAPITNSALTSLPIFKTIISEFKNNQDIW
jgi:hypothetical protein